MADTSIAAAVAPWSLAAAVERLLPVPHRALLVASERAAQAQGAQSRSPGWLDGGRAGLHSGEESRRAAVEASLVVDAATADLADALRRLIARNDIVVFGRRGSLASSLAPIDQDQARDFRSFDLASSRLLLSDGQTTIYSVHLLPPLLAPGFEQRLSGLISDVIAKNVFLDPEIVALMGKEPATNLADAVMALPEGKARISLGDTPKVIARKIEEWDVLATAATDEQNRAAIVAIASDRLWRLLKAIRGGTILLEAESDGVVNALPRTFSSSQPLALCVVEAAFYRAGDDSAPVFSDVILGGSAPLLEPARAVAASVEAYRKKPGAPVSREMDRALDLALMKAADQLQATAPLFRSGAEMVRQIAQLAQAYDIPLNNNGQDYERAAETYVKKFFPALWSSFVPERDRAGLRAKLGIPT